MKKANAPWDDAKISSWLENLGSWKTMRRLIHGTLKLEPKDNSHEIRAAASMVIMLCRTGLWGTEGDEDHHEILDLAARQLSAIKHLYQSKARIEPKLKSNPRYRTLLTTLDQEIRILEARCTDPKPTMPNSPPLTWGRFWFDEEA